MPRLLKIRVFFKNAIAIELPAQPPTTNTGSLVFLLKLLRVCAVRVSAASAQGKLPKNLLVRWVKAKASAIGWKNSCSVACLGSLQKKSKCLVNKSKDGLIKP